MIEDQILDIFAANSAEELQKLISQTTNPLITAAANFKKNYLGIQEQIQAIENISMRMQLLRHSAKNSTTNLPVEYAQLKKARAQLMSEAWWQQVENNMNQFQFKLNEILGQKISTVYVTTSGRGKNKQVHIYELPLEGFTKPGISSQGKLVGRYSISLKQLRNKAKEIFPLEKRDMQALSDTYLVALERYNAMKKHNYNGFYWKNSKKQYEMIRVSNKGDIGEAFLNAALGEQKIMMSQNIEGNLKRFAKLVAQVDNASGLLFGDFRNSQGMEYQAKSEGASTLGLQQMVNLADEILTGNITTISVLKQKQKQYLKQSYLRNEIKTELEETTKNLIKELILVQKNS